MSSPLPPSPLRRRGLIFAACAAVCLGSFLSFAVQPLVGKLLLPARGGSASTWVGTMVFFQTALLLAYAGSVWLLRRPLRDQIVGTLGLALLALAATSLGGLRELARPGLGGLLLGLAWRLLPATLLLFSLTPLLHGWLRRAGQPLPYYLFAVSNAGGLGAVLLYPLLVERLLPLGGQIVIWRTLLALLLALLGAAAWLLWRETGSGASAPAAEASPAETDLDPVRDAVSPARFAAWAGLGALSCASMLGATHHLAAEIGSGPLAWTGPFALFLLGYLVVFAGGWRPSFTLACVGWHAIGLAGFVLTKGVSDATVDGGRVLWLLSLSASCSFCCNGLLHDTMPRARFVPFYLAIAAGGVLGGLFASLAAPFLFLRPSEFLAIATLVLLLGVLRLVTPKTPLACGVAALVVLAPVLGQAWLQTSAAGQGFERIRRLRNLYGASVLRFEKEAVILSNETTTHGTQLLQSPEARRQPTLYYTESTALGRALEALRAERPALRVGVIGLGAGTVAAYARPGDIYEFWDIDPQALRIARDYFTFVEDSAGQVDLHLGDGRRGLAASGADYDLVVVDAFSGDAIPPHLLTAEALHAYAARLQARDGLLLIHTSSRYHDHFPVVGATAGSIGRNAVRIATTIAATAEDRDWDATFTQYILVVPPSRLPEALGWFPAEEDGGRVTREVTTYRPGPRGLERIWTDERHADLDTFLLGRFLRGTDSGR